MNELLTVRLDRWSSRAGWAALLGLVCAVSAPDGFAWTSRLVAAGLTGSVLTAAILLSSRALPARA